MQSLHAHQPLKKNTAAIATIQSFQTLQSLQTLQSVQALQRLQTLKHSPQARSLQINVATLHSNAVSRRILLHAFEELLA